MQAAKKDFIEINKYIIAGVAAVLVGKGVGGREEKWEHPPPPKVAAMQSKYRT